MRVPENRIVSGDRNVTIISLLVTTHPAYDLKCHKQVKFLMGQYFFVKKIIF